MGRKKTSPGFNLANATTVGPPRATSTQPDETSIVESSVSVNIAPEAAVAIPAPATASVDSDKRRRPMCDVSEVFFLMNTLNQY
jgi:hypothetical protein